MTTPGIMLKRVAEKAGEGIPAPLAPSEERPVYLIGFHTLSAGKDAVLKALWQAGAAVCLHADSALAGGGPVHWVCRRFRTWMEEWHAEAVPAGGTRSLPESKRDFFPGLRSALAARAARGGPFKEKPQDLLRDSPPLPARPHACPAPSSR